MKSHEAKGLKQINHPKKKDSESLPILAPEAELICPAGPLLDRLETLQRWHGIPEQQSAIKSN